jgi:hypothetical protein
MGAVPCGNKANVKKVEITNIEKKKILRSLFESKYNPFEVSRTAVYFEKDSKIHFIKDDVTNKQILLNFKVTLLEPEELDFIIKFKTRRGDKLEDRIEVKKIQLKKEESIKFDFADSNETFFAWGGLEDIINEKVEITKSNMKSIIDLYSQNFKKIREIKVKENCIPFYLQTDSSKEVFVEGNCLYLFKEYIKKHIFCKIKYHFLQETVIETREKCNFNIVFEFQLINFIEKKLEKGYRELEMKIN